MQEAAVSSGSFLFLARLYVTRMRARQMEDGSVPIQIFRAFAGIVAKRAVLGFSPSLE
jgi:hypothetical protein